MYKVLSLEGKYFGQLPVINMYGNATDTVPIMTTYANVSADYTMSSGSLYDPNINGAVFLCGGVDTLTNTKVVCAYFPGKDRVRPHRILPSAWWAGLLFRSHKQF